MKKRVNAISESYKHYRFKNERYKVSADYKEYKDIVTVFLEELFKELVTKGLEIELPSKLGVFVLEQYDTNRYIKTLENKGKSYWSTDKRTEKLFFEEYGKKMMIPYDGAATEGRMWTFSWLKSKNGSFKNKTLYAFNLVRSNVRSTSNKSYSQLSKRLTVHDFYKERGYKIYRNLIKKPYNKQVEDAENCDDSFRIGS